MLGRDCWTAGPLPLRILQGEGPLLPRAESAENARRWAWSDHSDAAAPHITCLAGSARWRGKRRAASLCLRHVDLLPLDGRLRSGPALRDLGAHPDVDGLLRDALAAELGGHRRQTLGAVVLDLPRAVLGVCAALVWRRLSRRRPVRPPAGRSARRRPLPAPSGAAPVRGRPRQAHGGRRGCGRRVPSRPSCSGSHLLQLRAKVALESRCGLLVLERLLG